MISIKKALCVSLFHYFVCGNIIRNQPSNSYGTTSAPQKLPVSTPSSVKCEPDKSLNSRNDIKVMIDFVSNQTSLVKRIKQNYQSKAEMIRDKHLKDLNEFTAWFEHQPEHLKDVLQQIETVRKAHVEPVAEVVAGLFGEYPKLERSYNKKNDMVNALLKKLNKYSMVCMISCEDQHVKEHKKTKRNVQDDFYCSSLEDLHKEITEKLDEFAEEINNHTLNILSSEDNQYEEKIDDIKSKIKDEALNEFGRTMYDILSLEYEYFKFMDDLSPTDLHEAFYEVQSLGLQVDAKLLQLEQAIEKFGQHCKSCGPKTLVRNARRADLDSIAKTAELTNLVDELIGIKLNEIADEVQSDFYKTFSVLDALIQKTEEEEDSMENLKPIQEEIDTMTKAENEALSNVKNIAKTSTFNKILELIKKFKDLLKLIMDIFDNIPK